MKISKPLWHRFNVKLKQEVIIATPFFKPKPAFVPRPRFQKKEAAHRINELIKAPEVRVVGDGIESAVYPIAKALQIAQEAGVDLVEISPTATPPVCKVIDYKKFLYEQKKKAKETKAKAQKVVVKEIRFGAHIDDHDFNFKKNHAVNFLKEGAKVKVYVFFRGREIVYKDQGEILLLRFANELEEFGKAEQLPQMEGKKMHMIISPKKK